MEQQETELRGRTAAWGAPAVAVLLLLVAIGLFLRLRGLSAEGFGDDEVHKWLAANRYLHGVFSGGVSIWVVALLGRRLFGRGAALLAAALATFSTTLIGYQRVAKEDTLLGL